MQTIVVGAGIAGLWIAEKLQERGDTVIVLEKADYIGGRILTSKHGYEIGAGRISTKHTHTMGLIKRFGLQTFPLSHAADWKALGDAEATPNTFNNAWAPIISLLAQTPDQGHHTLRGLSTKTLGPEMTDSILQRFGYRAEMDTLRADMGIRAFQNEMGTETSSSLKVVYPRLPKDSPPTWMFVSARRSRMYNG